MTVPIKPRRVDFWAGDWLGGTMALSLAERGLYITACALIYAAGGPITRTELRRTASGGRTDTFNAALLKLIDKGKLQLSDGMIDQARCEREIAKARERIDAQQNYKTIRRDEAKLAYAEGNKITKKRHFGDISATKQAEMSPHVLNETNDLPTPYARAKAESQEKKKESKILRGDRGVAALPSAEPAAVPRAVDKPPGVSRSVDTPSAQQIAEVDALVQQATAALRGGVPKGIRDAAAYGAAIKANKFTALVKNLNAWAGYGLDGEARFAAWEVLAAAERAGARSGMSRAERRNFDRLAGMYRATGPPDDMAQAA